MSNYAEYICKGAHCKCMDKDCTKFHNGDHTCPSSTPMTPRHDRDELRRRLYVILGSIYLGEYADGSDYYLEPTDSKEALDHIEALIDTHVAAIEREARQEWQIHGATQALDKVMLRLAHTFTDEQGDYIAKLFSQYKQQYDALRTTQEADTTEQEAYKKGYIDGQLQATQEANND